MFIVKCEKCGYEFYRGVRLPNLYRVYIQFGGKCPRCGREIGWVPRGIEVGSGRRPRREVSTRSEG